MATSYTYDDNARREDLLDIITNLDFNETSLGDTLSKSTAKDILHQWLTDSLKTPGFNSYVEGVDASYPATTNPVRLTNWCQIIRNAIQVSDSERASNSAGFSDRYAYETNKKMKEFKQDLEFSLMRGSLICANGSAARQMRGVKHWLSISCSSSGTSLIESALNDFLQVVWNGGIEVDTLYAPMYLKRKISGFTANSTRYVAADDKRLVNSVDVYQSDAAGMIALYPHRYVTITGTDTNYDLVGIKRDMFRIAWYRKPEIRELAKTGDATNGEVVGEMTLECLHQAAGFFLQRIL